jgi:antitoxin Phd
MSRIQRWNLQEAKAKLSEVVDLAEAGRPQIILRRGKPVAAVISIERFEASLPKTSLGSYLLHSPLRESNLDLSHADETYQLPTKLFEDVE